MFGIADLRNSGPLE